MSLQIQYKCLPLGGDMEMEEAASLRRKRSYSESFSLPQHRRNQKTSMGVKSSTYTDEQGEAVNDSDALLFHGIILRSQLVEMLKHKIFHEENQGVSAKINSITLHKLMILWCLLTYSLKHRRKCHTSH